MRHTFELDHPRWGEMTFEFTVESWGYSGNGWDDPGEAAEICIWRIELTGNREIDMFFYPQDEIDAWEQLIRESVDVGDYDSDAADDYDLRLSEWEGDKS